MYEAVDGIARQIRQTREEWKQLEQRLETLSRHQGQRKKDARQRSLQKLEAIHKRLREQVGEMSQ